jgi:3-hydroxybutyryl-CoA dehydrogenase
MSQQQPSVAIIGGGIMGGDIATVFAAANWNVHVMSPSQKTRDALPARLAAGLKKLGVAPAPARLQTCSTVEALP